MAHVEELFPLGFGRGTRGGPEFDVSVVVNDGGQEERVVRLETPLHLFSITLDRRKVKNNDLASLKNFYMAMRGPGVSFRLLDPTDHATTASGLSSTETDEVIDTVGFQDVTIDTGDGSKKDFQLVKTYSQGPQVLTRKVLKPVASTVRVSLDGTELPATIDTIAYSFTVNDATGIVTISPAPVLLMVVAAGFVYHVPARFGAGTNLDLGRPAHGLASAQVELVEIRDAKPTPENPPRGGSKDHGAISSDISFSLSQGVVHVIEPLSSAPNLKAKLPKRSDVEPGGDIFSVVNDSGTHPLDLSDDLGTLVVTIPAGQPVDVIMSENTAGIRTWFAF